MPTLIKGLFVTGVDTEIGKTTIAGAIAAYLADQGKVVGVLKPVQSGAQSEKGTLYSQDARSIAAMAGGREVPVASPYLFREPISPLHAARKNEVAVSIDVIAEEYRRLSKQCDVVIVEGAGGILAPLTETASMIDIPRTLGIPTLIVSHPHLGGINHTLLTVELIRARGVVLVGMVFNQPRRKKFPEPDFPYIEQKAQAPVFGMLPYLSRSDDRKEVTEAFAANIDTDALYTALHRRAPAARHRDLETLDKQHIWHPFTQMQTWVDEPVTIFTDGTGVTLRDTFGEQYLDGFSSYWCNIHGHGEKRLSDTLIHQAGKIAHSTFLGFSNEPAIELADKLISIAPAGISKVFYSDNGSTAVEVGVKMAYQYWRQVEPGTKRNRFLALDAAYHGDTVGAMSVGGVDLYHASYRDLLFTTDFVPPPYCYRCPLDKEYPACMVSCAELIDEKLKSKPGQFAALIIEPLVQCPGGIITAPHGYLKRAAEICHAHDVLLIADEVAVGFGRTGKMFAVDHEEVTPDIMALSKSITSGTVPFAATLTSQKLYDAFLGSYESRKTFFHGHTYTGNQLGAAVALENIALYAERDIIGTFQERGADLADLLIRFNDLPHVGDIRQRGFIAGIELVHDRGTKTPFAWESQVGVQVCAEAKRNGVLLRPLGNVVVLFPAPVITRAQLTQVVDTLYDAIVTVTERL
jgi:adenosylmethionine-8-amino-7-oxononanoate aminotransferase